MEIYNVVVMSCGWSSVSSFSTKEGAMEDIKRMEEGQKFLEGKTLKSLFTYGEHDAPNPPCLSTGGNIIYCSKAVTEYLNEERVTWRVVIEQELR